MNSRLLLRSSAASSKTGPRPGRSSQRVAGLLAARGAGAGLAAPSSTRTAPGARQRAPGRILAAQARSRAPPRAGVAGLPGRQLLQRLQGALPRVPALRLESGTPRSRRKSRHGACRPDGAAAVCRRRLSSTKLPPPCFPAAQAASQARGSDRTRGARGRQALRRAGAVRQDGGDRGEPAAAPPPPSAWEPPPGPPPRVLPRVAGRQQPHCGGCAACADARHTGEGGAATPGLILHSSRCRQPPPAMFVGRGAHVPSPAPPRCPPPAAPSAPAAIHRGGAAGAAAGVRGEPGRAAGRRLALPCQHPRCGLARRLHGPVVHRPARRDLPLQSGGACWAGRLHGAAAPRRAGTWAARRRPAMPAPCARMRRSLCALPACFVAAQQRRRGGCLLLVPPTQARHAPAQPCTPQVARGLGLDPGAAPKPRAARRPNDPDRPRAARPPKPPKGEGGAAGGADGEGGGEGGGGGAKGGRRASSKPPAGPKVKRPRGWNTWAPSEKWQDDPVVESGAWLGSSGRWGSWWCGGRAHWRVASSVGPLPVGAACCGSQLPDRSIPPPRSAFSWPTPAARWPWATCTAQLSSSSRTPL